MTSRHLDWRGCVNVRDLGGLPVPGGVTRWQSIVRADSLDRLTADGWATLHRHGVRTIVDLREDDERAATVERPPGLTVVHIPLDDNADADFWHRCVDDDADGTPLYYRPFVEHKADRCVAALTRRPWLRERRARVALNWMAAAGPERRAWMDAAGGRKLPAPVETRYSRDYAGRVNAFSAPLDPAGVALDYDLAGAEVRTLRVERAGTGLAGFADLAAPRRYPAPGAFGDAVLRIRLEEVDAVRFDSADAVGAALARDRGGVEIRLGERGRLHAARATVWFDDSAWHLSSAGRAADAPGAVGRDVRRLRRRRQPPAGGFPTVRPGPRPGAPSSDR